jgi:hypothetical protein
MDFDNKLIAIVSEDLDYLSEDWDQDIDDSSLRRASPVLRSLLIEGQLMKVANILNETVEVMAPKISKSEEHLNDHSIAFYQSGGAYYKGAQVQFFHQLNRAMSPEEVKEIYKKQSNLIGQNYPVKLSKFMKQTSFMVNGIKINREEVVKYIANKRGGAHYDSSRNIDKTGSKGELEKKYILLDVVHDGYISGDKNSVYYELLSIGQRLIGSPDVQRIRQIVSQHRAI